MNFIATVFLLVVNLSHADSQTQLIKKQIERIEEKVELQNKCYPTITQDLFQFCSGVKINKTELEKLFSLSVADCLSEIKKNNYEPLIEGSEKISKYSDLWDSFYNSTKIAETFHEEKLVLFKKTFSRLTCVHELLHTKQWSSSSDSQFSVQNRLKFDKEVLHILNRLVSDVEKLEKNKKTKEALALSNATQELISARSKLFQSSYDLDEKDVYAFFLEYCSGFNCSLSDRDVIIANLYQMKKKLPWRIRDFINDESVRIVKEKEYKAYIDNKYTPLSADDLDQVEKLRQKNWEQILSEFKNENIEVKKLVINSKDNRITDTIPTDIFNKLPLAVNEDYEVYLSSSKVNSGAGLGKFICQGSKNIIILNNQSTKTTLIHEYMHFLQSKKNSEFCKSLTEQDLVQKSFSKGSLSRESFESQILFYKSLIWKTEYEVYDYLSRFSNEIPALEKLNNNIQRLIFYEKSQPSKTKDTKISLSSGLEIPFNVSDDLPVIQLFKDKKILFDIGAMRSVINPSVLTSDEFNKAEILKMVTLQNVLGETLNAPYVGLNRATGISSIDYSFWVLANLKYPNFDGILGLDFFVGNDFIIYPKEKKIVIASFDKRPAGALSLQKNFDSKIIAIEFQCTSGVNMRLDSGSQVYGDISDDLRNMKKLKCNHLQIDNKFNSDLQNHVVFDHDVKVNLGWPWMSQFTQIQISTTQAWVNFVK